MLLRNPLHSLPSHFNYQWERRNDISDHTQQAPWDAWIKWRDRYFDTELDGWTAMLDVWLNETALVESTSTTSTTATIKLIIPFELLSNPQTGLAIVGKIREG